MHPVRLKSFYILAVAVLTSWCATKILAEGPPDSATQAAERTDANSRIAHQQLVEKARRGGIDVYFVGDSITRRWGASDPQYQPLLANWNTNFFGWNAANFGWGADRVENILWRLQNGELDEVNPKVIVVLAGINNIGTEPADTQKLEDISLGLRAIIDVCRLKAPHATVILTAVFPRNDRMAVVPSINQLNKNIEGMADGKQIRFVNINAKISDAGGRFYPEMVTPDNVHPALKLYQIWANALKPIFTEILGPPAKTDHAPPPTGDPGVKG